MLSYILNLLMGFDHYMYDVSFTGVKCETLGPCYSEPCDENNTKSSCTEINNLTDYTCSCKTGRSQIFHFFPRQSLSPIVCMNVQWPATPKSDVVRIRLLRYVIVRSLVTLSIQNQQPNIDKAINRKNQQC